jgi:hypothetical protein
MTIMIRRSAGNNPHACYHWWSYKDEPSPYANMRSPVLVSIATLRSVSDIPITVLDMSESQRDWGHFPEKLKFDVVPTFACLAEYAEDIPGWQYLSRLYDCDNYFIDKKCDSLLYVDCDVFWFKNPLPLLKKADRLCFDGWNSGFYYYDPHSASNRRFFKIFDAYTKGAIYSGEIRELMKKYISYKGWYGVWDEMILTYMAHEHPDLFNIIPAEEHMTIRTLANVDKSRVKMFHSNSTMVGNPVTKYSGQREHSRGLLGLLVREFHDNLKRILDDNDLTMMYTEAEREFCLSRQFSMLEKDKLLLDTIDQMGHAHAENCFNKILS